MPTCFYTLNFLAIFSIVFPTTEPLDKNNDAHTDNESIKCEDLPGLLAGLFGVVVHTLGKVALAPEPTPLVHPVGALGLGGNILNQEKGGYYQS